MPQADNITNSNFADLLSGEVQYIIPFFQRQYVWERGNWNTLYKDIEEILEPLEEGDSLLGHEHFFGPIVVRERPGQPNAKLKAFDVIDGQQRITTVYLMLAYFQRRLSVLKGVHPQAEEYRGNIGEWLKNSQPREAHDYDILKIYSFKNDRLATWYAVFDDETQPNTPEFLEEQRMFNPNGTIPLAFKAWMDRRFGRMGATDIWRWAEALTTCLQVVWIPLKAQDKPQAIFESLNYKGTPLTAIDLLVNYLLYPIIGENEDAYEAEALHSRLWLTPQTQITKWGGDFEEYLRYLFSIGETKMVGKGRRLYTFFKQRFPNINKDEASRQLNAVADSARIYGEIIGRRDDGNAAIGQVLADIRDTGMHSCRPFLLAALKAVESGDMSEEQAEKILREVRTLLVRVKMTTKHTTKYDSIFPPLLERIQREPNIIAALHKEIIRFQFWVSDQEFEDGLVALPLYSRPSNLDFTRLVLREVDKELTRVKKDNIELPDYSTLDTVEHIAPQTPTEEWLAEADYPDDIAYSALPIHTIGNLCLRNRRANSGMGQSSFAEKKRSFDNSGSVLAAEIAERDGPWNRDAIEKRSRELAEHALKVWAWSPTNRD